LLASEAASHLLVRCPIPRRRLAAPLQRPPLPHTATTLHPSYSYLVPILWAYLRLKHPFFFKYLLSPSHSFLAKCALSREFPHTIRTHSVAHRNNRNVLMLQTTQNDRTTY
jgi:hypothetical protein